MFKTKAFISERVWGYERWIASVHPAGQATVDAATEFIGGKNLSSVIGDSYPLLIKIIQANEVLSVQVHPDDDYARIHENSAGKTECWYILDAAPGAKIVIGHNAKDRGEVRDMIEQKRWNEFIREVPVHKGDFFFIAPGTVHAIKGGTLLLETQQNSDVTYRVYDYDRPGSDGKPRALHIAESIDVITAPFEESLPQKDPHKTINKNLGELVSCPYFSVWTLGVHGRAEIVQDQKFMLVSVVEGAGTVDGKAVRKGSHFILPYEYGRAVFEGDMQLVISAV